MEPLEIAVGDKVEHPVFGKGTVTYVWGDGDRTKVVVKFAKEVGERKLLVSAAKLKILNDRAQLLPEESDGNSETA